MPLGGGDTSCRSHRREWGRVAAKVEMGDDRAFGQFVFGRTGVTARRLTVAAWACLPALSALYLSIHSSLLPGALEIIPLETIYCLPIALCVVFSLQARAASEGVERSFWGFLAAANAILLLCEVLFTAWFFVISAGGPPPVALPFPILHAITAFCYVGMLQSMSGLHAEPVHARVRWELDFAAIGIIGLIGFVALYARPLMDPAGAPMGHVLIGAMYPLIGLVMLVGALANIVGFRAGKWRVWDALILVSLTVYALGISLWPLWYASAVEAGATRNYERGVLDVVQFAGHWVLMMAAFYRLTRPNESRVTRLPAPTMRRRGVVGASLMAAYLLAVPFVSWLAWSERADIQWLAFYAGAATLLVTLVVARSAARSFELGMPRTSPTDGLTGVWNRGFLVQRLGAEVDQARRYGDPLSVVVLDVDDLGQFNERYGHAEGDLLLTQVGRLAERVCGRDCTVARLGADEFAVIAPESDLMETTVLARRLLDVIAIEAGPRPGLVSVSAGVVSFPAHADDPQGLLSVAELAVAEAKTRGKAGIIVFEDDRIPGARPQVSAASATPQAATGEL